ncbi:glycosyl hydrolase catalytic core-domain-containing protein [Hypoxylon fragiforme]|uniref:glycosyl hydrolase catalytic core-domain-containing protein n=1 Tax=Hypoxylon fragiforme TaxID=63214 RepID=UPI0020C6C7C9|nr:glycosyl hydrolase catalytic core-domain-containing protein [Hypoxylon fragiforme]KAI2610966.1 glycosyl hydrolase catalytic core-domain-containing protein [Hypoxylon fragiforme]
MQGKLSILALCAASTVERAAAASYHRHMHPKRDIAWVATDTVVVTEYVTMTVTEGEELATIQTAAAPSSTQIVNVPAIESVILSTTSIAKVDVPTTVAEPTPSTSKTTMATLVKASSITQPVESPAIPTDNAAVYTPAEVVSTAAPSISAANVPSSSSSSSGTSKRGAAYNDPSLVSTLLGMTNKISWAYNWGSSPGNLDASVAYYPMLWSPIPDHSNDWTEKAEAALAKGSDCLLSFNEPDIPSQANMSPADAAAGHIKFMNPYSGRARISAPAISSSANANQGVDWLGQFFTACGGQCKVDFCTAHWYGPGGDAGAAEFLTHVKNVHTACQGKNVWITEFAAESGDTDAFMKAITQGLDSEEYSFVEKYSYFMLKEGSLMETSSTLSSYGKIFAGVA